MKLVILINVIKLLMKLNINLFLIVNIFIFFYFKSLRIIAEEKF
jgi:hypothetical protein